MDPRTTQASVSLGGTGRPHHDRRRFRLPDQRDRRRRVPLSPEGFFFRDTRFLSRWTLRINGQPPEALARSIVDPYSATYVSHGRPRPGRADSNLLVERRRYVGRGMREDLMVRNFSEEPAYCAVEVAYGADFADLFAVKEARVTADGRQEVSPEAGAMRVPLPQWVAHP